jgi:hypothetical protein
MPPRASHLSLERVFPNGGWAIGVVVESLAQLDSPSEVQSTVDVRARHTHTRADARATSRHEPSLAHRVTTCVR